MSLAVYGIGAPLRRVEDGRFLRGAGRFVDDLAPADAAWLHVLRSPHAAASIRGIDAAAARGMPGVLAVLVWLAAGTTFVSGLAYVLGARLMMVAQP